MIKAESLVNWLTCVGILGVSVRSEYAPVVATVEKLGFPVILVQDWAGTDVRKPLGFVPPL